MTYTENYRMKKPSGDDFVDISVINENTDAIDALLKAQAQQAEGSGAAVQALQAALEGKASLVNGKIPAEQLPEMDFIASADRGTAGGVASLGIDGKVPTAQLPAMNYDASGTATAAVAGHNTSAAAHADIRQAISDAQAATQQAGVTAQANLNAHKGDKNNPHAVTASQTGADPAGSAAAVQTNLDAHTGNTSNPHNVTASQVGADPAGSAAAIQANLGNLHVWKKTVTTKPAAPAGYTLGSEGQAVLMSQTSRSTGWSVEYASDVDVMANGTVVLRDPGTYGGSASPSSTEAGYVLKNIKNKFFRFITTSTTVGSSSVFFCPTDGTVTYVTNGTTYGASGAYAFIGDNVQKVSSTAEVPAVTTVTYPVSASASAYSDGVSGSTAYEYLGQLGGKPRIQTVSYVGLGTCGTSYKNSLTFGFHPKIVFIKRKDSSHQTFLLYRDTRTGIDTDIANNSDVNMKCEWNDKTLKWYADAAAIQMNESGKVYDCLAIG